MHVKYHLSAERSQLQTVMSNQTYALCLHVPLSQLTSQPVPSAFFMFHKNSNKQKREKRGNIPVSALQFKNFVLKKTLLPIGWQMTYLWLLLLLLQRESSGQTLYSSSGETLAFMCRWVEQNEPREGEAPDLDMWGKGKTRFFWWGEKTTVGTERLQHFGGCAEKNERKPKQLRDYISGRRKVPV